MTTGRINQVAFLCRRRTPRGKPRNGPGGRTCRFKPDVPGCKDPESAEFSVSEISSRQLGNRRTVRAARGVQHEGAQAVL